MENEFLQNLLRTVILNAGELFVFGVIMLLLQVLLRVYHEQKTWDRSSVIDLGYSFFLACCTPFFYIVPIAIVDSLVQQSPSLATLPARLSGDLPLLLQLFIAVFVIDFIGYWRHRIMHSRWLWPVHAIHHCSKRLDWLSTERFHALNYFVSLSVNVIAIQLLFGAEVALLAAFLRRFYNFFIHANIRMDYGIASYVFVSPRFHHWHHSAELEASNKNYCTFFSCIDWLFGTYYLPENKRYPSVIGERDNIKESFVVQFFHPFKVWMSWLNKTQTP